MNPDGFLLDPKIDGDGVMQLRVGRRHADLEFADDLAFVRMPGAGLSGGLGSALVGAGWQRPR
jgi:hypothetical protein